MSKHPIKSAPPRSGYIREALRIGLERFFTNVIRGAVHIGYRFRKEGQTTLPKGASLLVCNHVSFIDSLFITAAIRRPVRFLMDNKIYSSPLVNWLFRLGRVIPIAPRHKDPELTDHALATASEALRAGDIVVVFPEGKITRNGSLSEFKNGVCTIMKGCPSAPVIPMALTGLWGSFFSRRYGSAMSSMPKRFRAKISLRFGTPLKSPSASSMESAVQRLMNNETLSPAAKSANVSTRPHTL